MCQAAIDVSFAINVADRYNLSQNNTRQLRISDFSRGAHPTMSILAGFFFVEQNVVGID